MLLLLLFSIFVQIVNYFNDYFSDFIVFIAWTLFIISGMFNIIFGFNIKDLRKQLYNKIYKLYEKKEISKYKLFLVKYTKEVD